MFGNFWLVAACPSSVFTPAPSRHKYSQLLTWPRAVQLGRTYCLFPNNISCDVTHSRRFARREKVASCFSHPTNALFETTLYFASRQFSSQDRYLLPNYSQICFSHANCLVFWSICDISSIPGPLLIFWTLPIYSYYNKLCECKLLCKTSIASATVV